MGVLRLSPPAFWNLSLPELQAAIDGLSGPAYHEDPLTKRDLENLLRRYPDA